MPESGLVNQNYAQALQATKGNNRRAARLLQIGYKALHRKLKTMESLEQIRSSV